MADWDHLQQRLGHRFKDLNLLKLALTHASAKHGRISNERLEFLGDRVVGLVVADILYRHFPKENEGDLALRHAHLVSRQGLASLAEEVNLQPYIQVAASERSGGRGRFEAALMANAFEALLAALFLDGGLSAVEAFLGPLVSPRIARMGEAPKDPKTALQEWAQKQGYGMPEYRVVGRQGPDHAPVFKIQVALASHGQAVAEGTSKRDAERLAAETLLTTLRKA
ncbi:MAG: ribonuclease III [Holosporales bacterium]